MIILGHGSRILARCTGHRRGIGDRQLIVVIRLGGVTPLVGLAQQCHIVPHIVRPDGILLTSDVNIGCPISGLLATCRIIRLLVAAMSSWSGHPWFSQDRRGRRCPCDRLRSGSSQGPFREPRARSSARSPNLRLSYLILMFVG